MDSNINNINADKTSPRHLTDRLIEMISGWLAPLGYRVIHLEVLPHREKVLRLFIDFTEPMPNKAIGIEDCVKVSRALDEPLDQCTEINSLFSDAYELEVSSPGINRPLRTKTDFITFANQAVRIHTYRPLSGEELNNEAYAQRNPKQKNFTGILKGIVEATPGNTKEERIILSPSEIGSKEKLKLTGKLKQISEEKLKEQQAQGITLPLSLISKAHLEPKDPKDYKE